MPDVRPNTVRLPEELWEALEHESRATGQSQSELVRQAVTLHVAFLGALRAANDEADLSDLLRRVLDRLTADRS